LCSTSARFFDRFCAAALFCGQKELAYRFTHRARSIGKPFERFGPEIADRLKAGEQTIADHHPAVSILFC
jgi:hypothetical protein